MWASAPTSAPLKGELFCVSSAILPEELLFGHERIGDEGAAVEVFAVQADRCEAAVVIRGIIIDAAACIAAGEDCSASFYANDRIWL